MKREEAEVEVVEHEEFVIVKSTPGGAIEANFDAIRERIAAIVAPYEDVVVTPDYLPQAKKDRAYLNSLSKSIDQRRIDVKKRYNEPVQVFEGQVADLLQPIKNASALLDEQIKQLEEQERQGKRAELEKHWTGVAGVLVEAVPYSRIEDAKWLNKTCPLEQGFREMDERLDKIAADDQLLDDLNLSHPIEAKARFFETLDVAQAIARNKQLEEQKAAAERIEAQKAANLAAPAAAAPAPAPVAAPVAAPAEHVREWTISFNGTRKQAEQVAAALKALGLTGTVR